jgi:two-component system, response regulator PdtaR
MPHASILLVDDDRLILATYGKGLRRAGYVVEATESAAVALDLAARHSFDLAILDIRMPEMSGLELASLLMERNQLPTLFLSAYSDQATVEEAVVKGALSYVIKPIAVSMLVPAIETALGRARDLKTLQRAKGQLESALAAERNTSVAIGMMMERHHLPQKQAFDVLRQEARSRSKIIEALAKDLVDAEDILNLPKGRAKPAP